MQIKKYRLSIANIKKIYHLVSVFGIRVPLILISGKYFKGPLLYVEINQLSLPYSPLSKLVLDHTLSVQQLMILTQGKHHCPK